MSAWRRVAAELIPRYRELIERSDSPGTLWTDLMFHFSQSHRDPIDEDTIRGTYEFAKWTLTAAHNEEIATSTCCHFYEHLPTETNIRRLMSRFMSRIEILNLSEIFKYHLTPEDHKALMQELLASSE